MYIDFENNELPESIEDYIDLDNLSQSAIYTDTSQCTRFNPSQAQNPCNKYRQLDCDCDNDCCDGDCSCDSDCNCFWDCCDENCSCNRNCNCDSNWSSRCADCICDNDCCDNDCCDANCCYGDCSCNMDCCDGNCYCDSDGTSVIGYNGYCLKYKLNPCSSNRESCSSYCRCDSHDNCCDGDCSCNSVGGCSCDCDGDCCNEDCCNGDFSDCSCNIDSRNNTCSDCDSYCYKDMKLWSIKRIDSAAMTEYGGTPPNHSSNQSNNKLFRLFELNNGNMFNYYKWFKNAWDETSPYKLQRGHDVWPIRTMSGQQQTQNPKFYGE